jgi:hypothetical protein
VSLSLFLPVLKGRQEKPIGAFNHPNFANPNAALNNANFGRILGAGGARVVQFALKYMF